MPRIPIPEGQSIAPAGRITSRASASSFGADIGAGLANIGQATSQIGESLQRAKETADKFENANKLARGRQEWMMYTQDQMAAVERGEISYKGMTDRFQEKYAEWASGMNNTVDDPDMRKDLDLSMLEMETSLLGQIKAFEVRKSAESVRENYNGITNSLLGPVLNSKNEADVRASLIGYQDILNQIPLKEVRDDADKLIQVTTARKIASIRAQEGNPDMSDLSDALEAYAGSGVLSPSEFISLKGTLEDAKSTAVNVLVNRVQGLKSSGDVLAETGDLPDDYIGLVSEQLDKIRSVSPEIADEIVPSIEAIRVKNDANARLYDLPLDDLMGEVDTLRERGMSEKNPETRATYLSQANRLQADIIKRNENLKENFVSITRTKNQIVSSSWDDFKTSANITGVSEEEKFNIQKTAFTKYADALESEAKRMGVTNIHYLPKQEVDQYVGSIRSALSKPDGTTQAEQQISSLVSLYGTRSTSVLSQIIKDNEDLAAIGAFPIIRSPEHRRLLVEAMNKAVTDPDKYVLSDADKKITVASIPSSISRAMSDNNMLFDFASRREALFALEGYSKNSNAKIDAQKILFGDIRAYQNTIIPNDYNASMVFSGARAMLRDKIKEVKPLRENVNGMMITIDTNDVDYRDIEFMNASEGGQSGIAPIYPGTRKPMRDKNGKIVFMNFADADRYGRQDLYKSAGEISETRKKIGVR